MANDLDYESPWQVAQRSSPGACLCNDESCNLSGGLAHVGPCEPCACGKRHAIAECPHHTTSFVFRGKTISGPAAYVLLRAIRLVQKRAPDATPDDIAALSAICDQFSVEFSRSIGAASDAELLEAADG
jgi:hypothetical protein